MSDLIAKIRSAQIRAGEAAVCDHFWHSEDRVVQFHPPESEHINNHTNCLHLWRPVGV